MRWTVSRRQDRLAGRGGSALLLLALCVACGARPREQNETAREGRAVTAQTQEDSLHRLSLREPTVRQTVDSATANESTRGRFVLLQVTGVTNPARVALSFELNFVARGTETTLGTASLFPADNPGRFIIPTLGRVRGPGQLVLTLASPDSGAGRAAVIVRVRQLAFVDQ